MTMKVLIVSAIISQMFIAAFAIKCYQCNSATDQECHDLSLFKPHLTAGFFKECDDFDSYNGSIPFCRKTEYLIKFADNLKRTIRSCGWIKSNQNCFRADKDDHGEMQCQCFEDGCNGSSQIKVFSIFTILVVSFLCLLR